MIDLILNHWERKDSEETENCGIAGHWLFSRSLSLDCLDDYFYAVNGFEIKLF